MKTTLYQCSGETVTHYGVYGDSYAKVLKKIAKFTEAMVESEPDVFLEFTLSGPSFVAGDECYYALLFVSKRKNA